MLLTKFQRVRVYLNKPIQVDELIKLTNQSIQRLIEMTKIKKILFLKAKNKLIVRRSEKCFD